MREIKFRQFFKGKFHYWGVNAEKEVDGSHFTGPLSLKDVESQQYTGLKDANGVEIYEGDIVKIEGFGSYTVSYTAPSFSLLLIGPCHELWMIDVELCDCGCVVVGNIYQNSDLLS